MLIKVDGEWAYVLVGNQLEFRQLNSSDGIQLILIKGETNEDSIQCSKGS